MATTLPPNVNSVLHSESSGSHTQHMTEIKSNIANSNNIARLAATKKFDEPGAIESRAVEKVLRLPKAG